jgi:hypothetical protein
MTLSLGTVPLHACIYYVVSKVLLPSPWGTSSTGNLLVKMPRSQFDGNSNVY